VSIHTPLPAGEEKARVVEAMFDRIAPRYDLMNHLMTGGLDVLWRRRAVRELRLPRGATVADLACGPGELCRELHRQGYRAIGVDSSAGMLALAHGADELIRADILDLPIAAASVDGVTSGFALRNVVDISRCAAEMARVVRPGGRLAVLDLAEPRAATRWLQSTWVEHVVPRLGALLSDGEAYRYLPASTAYLPDGPTLVGIFRAAGFTDTRRILLGFGAVQLLVGTRTPASGPERGSRAGLEARGR
jgi:demethylmenaquinone methyltransferase / 2-methoxy-6-polyprenyl-1,4-benzoquinol methylase